MKKRLASLFCCCLFSVGYVSTPIQEIQKPQVPVYEALIINASPYDIDIKIANLEKRVLIKEGRLSPGAKLHLEIPEDLLGYIGVVVRFYKNEEPTGWFVGVTTLTKEDYERFPGKVPQLKIKEPKKKGIDV